MLNRIDELIAKKHDFAFETTLASKSFAALCREVQVKGYIVCLAFFWLDNVELAIERVKQRVSEGGHNIPEDTIMRRYKAGLKNFFTLYRDIVNYWVFLDNSGREPRLIAEGKGGAGMVAYIQEKWENILKYANGFY